MDRRYDGGVLRPVVATVGTGVLLKLLVVLPSTSTDEALLGYWALVAAFTMYEVTQSVTRAARTRWRKAVARRAALVDPQLAVTADLEFSLAEYRVAFDRWPGHATVDWVPNLFAVMNHTGLMVQMSRRPEVCPELPGGILGVAKTVRLLVWRRLSLAQRSWFNLALQAGISTFLLTKVSPGDECFASMFQSVAARSLPGRLVAQAMVSVLCYFQSPVMVRHTALQAGQSCLFTLAFLHMASTVGMEDPQLLGGEAQLQLALMTLLAAVLWHLIMTVRVAFAAQAMNQFLAAAGGSVGPTQR
eukprot:jgi/Tetstr1/442084/TSEL_003167.t1